jgi:cytochrome c
MNRRTALAIAVLLPAFALAEDRATTKDAELLVHRAVDFLKKEGKEKALPVFSDPKGPFTYRDLYIVALDPKSVVLAHGTKKDLIGKNNWNAKDADGKFFSRESVEIAMKQGKGWNEYKFQNPATGKVENKVAYVERVDDVIVLCGAYKP